MFCNIIVNQLFLYTMHLFCRIYLFNIIMKYNTNIVKSYFQSVSFYPSTLKIGNKGNNLFVFRV